MLIVETAWCWQQDYISFWVYRVNLPKLIKRMNDSDLAGMTCLRVTPGVSWAPASVPGQQCHHTSLAHSSPFHVACCDGWEPGGSMSLCATPVCHVQVTQHACRIKALSLWP